MENQAVSDEVLLSDIVSGTNIARTRIEPNRQLKIQDWLKRDHQHNALNRDITNMARHMDSMRLWLRVGVAMLCLVFIMQLMLWYAS